MRRPTPRYRPVLSRTTGLVQMAMVAVAGSGPCIRARVSMTLLLVGASLALASPADAVDGVIEINHEKALMGGVTPTDGAGYPVLIDVSGSGSYRLTSNLIVPDENTNGIEVNGYADTVTIDLNGFAILGSTSCTGTPLVCSPTGSGDGIRASSFIGGVVVANGTIRGMGRDGISVSGKGARIEAVRAISNGARGIAAGSAYVVSSSSAGYNGSWGISGYAGVVSNSAAYDNGSNGIHVSNSTVQGNVTTSNGGSGLWGGQNSAQANVAVSNGGDGIYCTNCTVIKDRMSVNTGFGLTGSWATGYGGNTIVNNVAGTVSGGCNEIGTNLCQTNTTCP